MRCTQSGPPVRTWTEFSQRENCHQSRRHGRPRSRSRGKGVSLGLRGVPGYTRHMRVFFLVPLALAALLVGCSKESTPPTQTTNATTSGNPLDAPGQYLGALAKGQQIAVKTVDTASLNQAIQLFQVDNGRFPKDLNELVTEKFIPKIPDAPVGMKIVYDAKTGTVKVVKQ